jgi:hypothetical protein
LKQSENPITKSQLTAKTMNPKKFFTSSFLTVSFLFLHGFLFSQEKLPDKIVQPELGQEGKDVRWFPTPQELVDKMLDMAKITPSDFLIDLGSGDGRTVITAAKRGVRGIGVEYNPDLVELSKVNAVNEGVKDMVQFIKADLFNYDFSKATVLTLFLLPEINLRLRPRILDMKPGTRVVSTTFTMQNWQHDDMVTIVDPTSKWTTAYLWIVPAKVNGTWKCKEGELNLVQKFQMVTGKITLAGKPVEISNGKLRGSDFTFIAGKTKYTCKVTGSTMKGTSESEGETSNWTAKKLN